MKQIIYAEWLKVKSYRTFWVMVSLALLVIPAGNYIVADKFSSGELNKVSKMLGNPFSFPEIWLTAASINSYISVLFGLLLIILVTNEYTYRTNRQNVIDGWDRKEFVYAKLCWLVGLSLAALAVASGSALVLGIVYGGRPFSLEGFSYMIYYWLQLLVMLTIALLISVWVKRAGLSIVLFLAYNMMLEQLLVMIVKFNFGNIGGLLPLQSGDELLPFPLVGKMIPGAVSYDAYVYVSAMLVYIGGGISLVFRKILKSDL
ncbi:ABC transporter permease [Chitinophaga nivalis]|uniref:ABC transporter permease n=1 Tax=Chitinophaga nivalis TaxID=2991709 RepID=A0ABT3ISZ2_9BACT|nr:ABC transporter permease [Chitinophaga nivalis]MCW3463218.1 ABC transporter permease [Chitinophaga nivalis]MCW3487092.1 ABC transporter permease [Chitinophaga nivalis]